MYVNNIVITHAHHRNMMQHHTGKQSVGHVELCHLNHEIMYPTPLVNNMFNCCRNMICIETLVDDNNMSQPHLHNSMDFTQSVI